MALFTLDELKERLSAEVVRQIYDDDNDGDADAGPIARLIADASSRTVARLLPIYRNALSWTPVTVPNEAKRIALDYAEYYGAQRHSEYVRRASLKDILREIDEAVQDLRSANSHLDSATEKPANNGGFTVVNESTITGVRLDGSGGMGDF